MQSFEFHQPRSLAQALEQLRASDSGRCLAGGQSLLPIMKMGLAAPTHLISLSRVPELKVASFDDGALSLGAGLTHREVARRAREVLPALADLADGIGDPQVRNRGTLGGSLAHADPAADYPAALLALEATVVTDRREIVADAFFTGMLTTALAEDEIVVAVRFPAPRRAAYVKLPNPASKYAVVGAMVAESGRGVRVGITGAAPVPFRWEAAERALKTRFADDALTDLRCEGSDFSSDVQASAEYRAHLVGVMTRRAVRAALSS